MGGLVQVAGGGLVLQCSGLQHVLYLRFAITFHQQASHSGCAGEWTFFSHSYLRPGFAAAAAAATDQPMA